MITDQPGACMGSQAWSKCDVTRLHAKRELKVKCNTLMHQAIMDCQVHIPYQTKMLVNIQMLLVGMLVKKLKLSNGNNLKPRET